MELLKIGQILTDADTERDAIHIAVLPAKAFGDLTPGAHIGLRDGRASPDFKPHIGISDPFLNAFVPNGQRFYIFMYPGSINGLKHNWTHKDVSDERKGSTFPFGMGRSAEDEAKLKESIEWITDYARHTDGINMSFDDMIRITHEWLSMGEYHNTGDNQPSLPREYWDHFERVTGIRVAEVDKHEFFTCAC